MAKKKKDQTCLAVLIKIAIIMVVVLALIAGATFLLFSKLDEYFNRGENVIVPDFRGMHIDEAVKIKPPGMILDRKDTQYNDQYPKDYVTAQFPEPGTIVKPDKRVSLSVSLGSQKVIVPSLKNRSLREVGVALINSRLKHGKSAYVYSDSAPHNAVVSQSPLAGEEYPVNRDVDLLVSLGKAPRGVILPNLSGSPLEEARKRTASAGLRAGRVYYKYEPGAAKYVVLSSDPAPYSALRQGDIVNFLVSSGSSGLVSSDADIAKFEIMSKPVFLPILKAEPPLIIEESKEKEAEVKSSDKRTELFETFSDSFTTSSQKTSIETTEIFSSNDLTVVQAEEKREKEINFIVPDGFMAKEVKFILVSPAGRKLIYSKTLKPLELVKVKVPVLPNSKVQIYINDVPVEERKID